MKIKFLVPVLVTLTSFSCNLYAIDSDGDGLPDLVDPYPNDSLLPFHDGLVRPFGSGFSGSMVNGYVQAGSQMSLSFQNNSPYSLDLKTLDIYAGSVKIGTTSDAGLLGEDGMLVPSELFGVTLTLNLYARQGPFKWVLTYINPISRVESKFTTNLVVAPDYLNGSVSVFGSGSDYLLIDSDLDGYEDSIDALPFNANEAIDSDNDGVGNNADMFDDDPYEAYDSDHDGFGDELERKSLTDPLDAEDYPQTEFLKVIPLSVGVGQLGVRISDESKLQLVVKSPVSGDNIISYTWSNDWFFPKVVELDDRNGDGVSEVAIFGYNKLDQRPQLSIKDGATAKAIGTWSWPALWGRADFMELDDINNDGINDVAIFGFDIRSGRANFIPKDGNNATLSMETVVWPSIWNDINFVEVPDLTGDGIREIAIHGKRQTNGINQLVVRDLKDPSYKVLFNWPDSWSPAIAGAVSDISNDGIGDVWVGGVRSNDGRTQIVIKDGTDKSHIIARLGWPAELAPDDVRNISDRDGDGVDDIALVATRTDDGRRQVVVKSAITGTTLETFGWNSNWDDTEVHEIPDITGDGRSEFALLGNNKVAGFAQMIVVDSATGKTLKPFSWPAMDATTATLVLAGDVNDDNIPDIGLYSVIDGKGTLQIKSGENSAALLKTVEWPSAWK